MRSRVDLLIWYRRADAYSVFGAAVGRRGGPHRAVANACPQLAATSVGGVNARTAGAGCSQRSISMSVVRALVALPKGAVPTSRVSTLGLPYRSGSPAASAGSSQAPVAIT